LQESDIGLGVVVHPTSSPATQSATARRAEERARLEVIAGPFWCLTRPLLRLRR